MFNEKIVVTVTPFSGTSTTDKNGKEAVMLQCIAGKMPNRNVIAGTVAERMGIKVGLTYLMQVREAGYDQEFGRDFTFLPIRELSTGTDIIDTCRNLTEPEIVTIPRPEGYEEHYTRKGDAVESERTKRIHEGKYIPANRSSYDHTTAKDVKKGTSQFNSSSEGYNGEQPIPLKEVLNMNE